MCHKDIFMWISKSVMYYSTLIGKCDDLDEMSLGVVTIRLGAHFGHFYFEPPVSGVYVALLGCLMCGSADVDVWEY